MSFSRMVGIAVLIASVGMATAQSWTAVHNVPDIGASSIELLTDGRVLVQNYNTPNNWWTLTPDQSGNYATGTWTQVASMPSGYAPFAYGSAVLPDGRYIVEGGEDNMR